VCCSVWLCVAVCCSVLQCVAVCCSVLTIVSLRAVSDTQHVCCRVLQYVAVFQCVVQREYDGCVEEWDARCDEMCGCTASRTAP